MKKKILSIACVLVSVIGFSQNSSKPYEWPSHRNWFLGSLSGQGGAQIINMNDLSYTASFGNYTSGTHITAYEGVSAASDDEGKLLFYQNGRKIWNGVGSDAVLAYDGLLSGNTGSNPVSTASQGTITIKHPLNNDRFHIFTTNAANEDVDNGLNHFVVSRTGTLISGPTRLGDYRTTEGIAATSHSNGKDIWVTVQESGSENLHSYLISEGGNVSTAITSSGLITSKTGSRERGGLAFSFDGSRFVSAHAQNYGDKGIVVLNFNDTTGVFSNSITMTGDIYEAQSPHDVTFSPDGNRVYFSDSQGDLYKCLISTQTITKIELASANGHAAIEIGPDGNLYQTAGAYGGEMRKITGSLNNGGPFTLSEIDGTETSLGLPTMYIPPTEKLQTNSVGTLCRKEPAVDLSTTWQSDGASAENPSTYPNAYSGSGIVDAGNGVFDPRVAGVGTHTITFSRMGISNTINIRVKSCNPNISDTVTESSCGSLYGYSSTGIYIDTIIGENMDTIRTYDLTIYSKPNVTIYNDTICQGEESLFDAGAGFNSYQWSGMGSGTSQSIVAKSAGTYTVKVSNQNGCLDISSAILTVNPLPNSVASASSSTFAEGTFVQLFSNAAGYNYSWSPTDETNENIITSMEGTHTVTVTNPNTGCSLSSSVAIEKVDGNNCTDTIRITVVDTNYVTKTNYVDVYDSLIVDLNGDETLIATPFTLNTQVKIYPNPASDNLTLEVLDASATDTYLYQLFSVTGQNVVSNGFLDNEIKTIDLSSLNSGTYYVRFYDSQFTLLNTAPVVIKK
ncbi:MAG: hypothetical protein CMD18_07440 [Flavobacteriales bacterium]|nr:hypothetical protein [Flavobacteriales bacterium]